MEKSERWLPVRGFEDRYLVSSFGRIFGQDKILRCGYGKKRRMPGKIIQLHTNTKGYLRVSIGRDGKFKTRDVHRLVALHFIPRIIGKLWVNHKNGCKTDNRAKNLEFSTPSENMQHAQDTGLNLARFSEKQKNAARFNLSKTYSHRKHNGQI